MNQPEGRDWTPDDIRAIVEADPIVVFGKGEKDTPMCGFSHRAYQVLAACGHPFTVVNVFRHDSIRPALRAFSDFPTTPQVFVGGELIGGSDIALELYQSGELQKKMEAVLARS
ncbi:MAG: hypothetical protein HYV63_27875 [Candidatus Schekmanbacteria bacterium]|nr:hypothetical protein [Candidatus Schekmanbacteria bacterium]